MIKYNLTNKLQLLNLPEYNRYVEIYNHYFY